MTIRDDDLDEDDDDDFDEDEDDDEDEDEDDDEDEETWQVSRSATLPLKDGLCLTSGTELPRLAAIFQLSQAGTTRPASRPTACDPSQAPVTG